MSPAEAVPIRVCGLRKSFGHTVALDGLDLEVRAGEVHGFLGPNGSGKSTTIRVLLGLLRADRGAVEVLGADPWRAGAGLHRRLAYVPGEVSLWPELTGGEVIDLLGRLRGGIDPRRRSELVERFELDPTKKCRAYSKGNCQKVALVAALASDAELLLLDEPTAGLDPLMEQLFRDVVEADRGGGRAVLLSSHILSEVEALCDRVGITPRTPRGDADGARLGENRGTGQVRTASRPRVDSRVDLGARPHGNELSRRDGRALPDGRLTGDCSRRGQQLAGARGDVRAHLRPDLARCAGHGEDGRVRRGCGGGARRHHHHHPRQSGRGGDGPPRAPRRHCGRSEGAAHGVARGGGHHQRDPRPRLRAAGGR